MVTVGIDEVGRGPLAGPLVVCACAQEGKIPKEFWNDVGDSKQVNEKKREEIFQMAHAYKKEGLLRFALANVTAKEIDRIGMTAATRKGVKEALRKLDIAPEESDVRLDGLLYAPKEFKKQRTIIKGDQKEKLIGLASIIAKVARDTYMTRQARKYPEYGFERHKGYGTREHREAIRKHGNSPLHRASFCRNIGT